MAVREYDRKQRTGGEGRDRPKEIAAVTAKVIAKRRLWLYLCLSFVFWVAISTWRSAKWTAHRASFGLLSNAPGRMALALSALFLLVLSGLTGEAILAGTGLWTVVLLAGAAVYGARAWPGRRRWEESTKDDIRGNVPGHSERYPPDVSFSRHRWLPLQDGRWIPHFDFNFRIPPELHGAAIFEVEANIVESLRVAKGSTYFLDWSRRKQTGRCYAKAVEDLPERIDLLTLWEYPEKFPGAERLGPNRIPIGVTVGGLAFWEPREVPHVLVSGSTGGGKSVAERAIIAHALRYPNHWRLLGMDPKRVELSALRQYDNVDEIATDLEDMAGILERAIEVMENRYREMEAAESGATPYNHIHDLDPSRESYLIVIDELAMLTAQTDGSSEEAKAQKERAEYIQMALGRLVAEARAAAIHLLIATQQPGVQSGVMTGNTRMNITGRLAQGQMDSSTSRMALRESDAATGTEQGEAKGRAIWQADSSIRRCQTVLTNWSHIFWMQGDYDRAVRAAAEEGVDLPDFCYEQYEEMAG